MDLLKKLSTLKRNLNARLAPTLTALQQKFLWFRDSIVYLIKQIDINPLFILLFLSLFPQFTIVQKILFSIGIYYIYRFIMSDIFKLVLVYKR